MRARLVFICTAHTGFLRRNNFFFSILHYTFNENMISSLISVFIYGLFNYTFNTLDCIAYTTVIEE
jgi:hypothetical protein